MPSAPDSKQSTVTPSEQGSNRYEDRRTRETEGAVRTGERSRNLLKGRTGEAERIVAKGTPDKKAPENPIFAKLAIVSTFLMSLFICSISFIILWEQKQQFVSQLTTSARVW